MSISVGMTILKIYGGSLSLRFLMHLIQQKHFTNLYNVKAYLSCRKNISRQTLAQKMIDSQNLFEMGGNISSV